MKIILAEPRGFCAGVNMAVESLERALELFGTPLYVYHEIVHNQTVVDRFRKRGVMFVDSLDEVPEGASLLYSAHGVAPTIRQEADRRRLRAIDATCPLVTKVHLEAVRFANEGYTILLIGHAGHDEVIGTMGEAPNSIVLVEDLEDVAQLTHPPDARLAFLTQTTLSVDEASIIIRAIKQRYPNIVGPSKDDICYATQNRQEAIRGLAPQADLVLVFGSQNSSNSQRLAELSRAVGKPAYLINEIRDLDPKCLAGVSTILITAGASAPEDVVQKGVRYLQDTFGAEVETGVVRQEDVYFQLPRELRVLMGGTPA